MIWTGLLSLLMVSSASCSDRDRSDDASCYHIEPEQEYNAYLIHDAGYCAYELGEVTPFLDVYGPQRVDFFGTCDEISIDQECQTCPADELDAKVMDALEDEYKGRCPNAPRDLIDFERGCMVETAIPTSQDLKKCCYTAIVVGECSLRG